MKFNKSFKAHCFEAMFLFLALTMFGACNNPETGLISYNGNYTGDEAVSFTLPDGSVEIRSSVDAADAVSASAGIACEDDANGQSASGSTGQGGFANGEVCEAAAEGGIYVSVVGEVISPGVYVMPEGARVYELINEAGGATADADTTRLNLVAKLEDGMQIVVPSVADAADGTIGAIGTEYGASSAGLVNINTAGLSELMTLTGIGKTRAEAIIKYRESSGGFKKPEDLMCVNGIKQGIYDGLKDQICVH